MRTGMPNLYTETNPSKSNPNGKGYETVIASDGRMGCDCRGWTMLKAGKPRECTHTKKIVAKYGLTTKVDGQYLYVVNTPALLNIKSINPANASLNGLPMPTPTVAQNAAAKPKNKLPTKLVTDDEGLIEVVVPPTPKVKPVRVVEGIRIIDLPDLPDIDAFVAPMLAIGFPEGQTLANFLASKDINEWAMEEKFDGHRKIVSVQDGVVKAWSRPSRGKDALVITLPAHIAAAFALFTNGTYDGELMVPGKISTDVTDGDNAGLEVFVVFHLLRMLGEDTTHCPYDEMREYLTEIFKAVTQGPTSAVLLSKSVKPSQAFVDAIWARPNGEGAILKRRAARYQPGARSADWIKVKGKIPALMTVVGFKKGENGPHSAVMLKGDDGSATTVKTLDNAALATFAKNPDGFIGRKLWIEFQMRTRDGSYRSPMWDRWENE